MDKKKIFKWESLGALWIIILGSLLHFTYDLSGGAKIVALFSAVNESVWEHLKLGYFALTFFILIEYPALKNIANNFFTGKFMGIISMNLFIVTAFYSHKYITGSSSLIFDIGSFMVGAVLCQLVSYKIISKKPMKIEKAAPILFVVLGLLFMYFTFKAPKLPIFMDSNTGKYGL